MLEEERIFEQFRHEMVCDMLIQGNEFKIVHEMGVYQQLHICYELAWKIMKCFLASQNIYASSPKKIIRKAAALDLINRPGLWFDFYEKFTSRYYNQEYISTAVEIADVFSLELKNFIGQLQKQLSKSGYIN